MFHYPFTSKYPQPAAILLPGISREEWKMKQYRTRYELLTATEVAGWPHPAPYPGACVIESTAL